MSQLLDVGLKMGWEPACLSGIIFYANKIIKVYNIKILKNNLSMNKKL